ncbi:MAG: hypothetical protein A2033_05755 [Bacteroidetes bacterium GWA2_31_9]|nr:MAG: hypothetical protein A2033_05755 [Bacteroidetes bacterium GWA2_31_9]
MLNHITALSTEAIRIIDLDYNIVYSNKAYADINGLTIENVTNTKCYNLLCSQNCNTEKCSLEVIKNGESNWQRITEFTNQSNEKKYYILNVKPFSKDGLKITGIFESFVEITDIIEKENLIIQKNKELKTLNEYKDKLFSIIAHDLRAPLCGIIGLSELLKNNLLENNLDNISLYIDKIYESSLNTNKLLDNITFWARSQKDKVKIIYTEFDLSKVIREELSNLYDHASVKHISLINKVTSSVFLKNDINILELILRNLLNNAIKFTNEFGSIMISCSQNTEFTEFSISDSGVGISAEKIEKILNSENIESTFGTVNEKGTGLGLLIVKEYLKYIKGSLLIESQLGKGSRFIVRLNNS